MWKLCPKPPKLSPGRYVPVMLEPSSGSACTGGRCLPLAPNTEDAPALRPAVAPAQAGMRDQPGPLAPRSKPETEALPWDHRNVGFYSYGPTSLLDAQHRELTGSGY